jgi:dGTPase
VVDILEKKGEGLNLTREVRDGILKHSKGYGKILPDEPKELAITMEGRVVRIADIIAYLNHDLDDAIRSGVILTEDIPKACIHLLGQTHSERATTMIKDLVYESTIKENEFRLQMSDEVFGAMATLREFLYENVYRSQQVHREFEKAKKIICELYTYFLKNEDRFRKELAAIEMVGCYPNRESNEQIVCDFIASLTDRHALTLFEKIFFPSPLV